MPSGQPSYFCLFGTAGLFGCPFTFVVKSGFGVCLEHQSWPSVTLFILLLLYFIASRLQCEQLWRWKSIRYDRVKDEGTETNDPPGTEAGDGAGLSTMASAS